MHKTTGEMGPLETSNSGANHAVLQAQTTGEVWDQYRIVILIHKALFCMEKTQMRAGNHREY